MKTDPRLRRRACAAEVGDEKWDVLSLRRSYGTAISVTWPSVNQPTCRVGGRTVGQPSEPTTVVERRVMRIKPKRLNASVQLTPQISSEIIPFDSIPYLCVMPVISNHCRFIACSPARGFGVEFLDLPAELPQRGAVDCGDAGEVGVDGFILLAGHNLFNHNKRTSPVPENIQIRTLPADGRG